MNGWLRKIVERTKRITSLLLLFLSVACLASPECFDLMKLDYGDELAPPPVAGDCFPNLPKEYKEGFAVGGWDYIKDTLHTRHVDENPFPLTELFLVLPRGEYGMACLKVNANRDLRNFDVRLDGLRGEAGDIGLENVRIARVAQSTYYYQGDFLVEARQATVSSGALFGVALLVNVPPGTKAGYYNGRLVLSADGVSRHVDVVVCVPAVDFPECSIPLGFYMPYFASDQGGREGRWAAKDYKMDTQKTYFKFLKTRGMNSPTIFHYRPEFKADNSKEIDFSTLDRLVSLITGAGGCKGLFLDLRFLASTAKDFAKMPAYQEAGLDDIAIYRDFVAQLCKHSEAKKYPPCYFMSEEEVAYHSDKRQTFLRFGPHLREVAGEDRMILLDNPTAAQIDQGIDFGHSMRYKRRQYNTWTDKGLAQTAAVGDEVWSYNFGFRRPSYGILLHRLNSQGHHQWADVWGKPWTSTVARPDGVVSSIRIESCHEGMVDYRILSGLRQQNADLLSSLIGDLPVVNAQYHHAIDARGLSWVDMVRWRAVLAQDKSGIIGKRVIGGEPMLRVMENHQAVVETQADLAIRALLVADDVERVPTWDEKRCLESNGTGPLRYMLAKERRNREVSSSDEEFKRINQPSYAGAWVCYNNVGINIIANQNHTVLGKAQLLDNDANLWTEDSMEFFFRLPDGTMYQLIVNSSDRKTWLKLGQVLESSMINVLSRAKGDHGYVQDIMIPWSAFGMEGKPKEGEAWTFNVGRQFHSWGQTMCWARVEESFLEHEKWGRLVFSGSGSLYLKNVRPGHLYEGLNSLEGTLGKAVDGWLRLRDGRGAVLGEKRLQAGTTDFVLEATVSSSSAPCVLSVEGINGTVHDRSGLPIQVHAGAFRSYPQSVSCLSGDVVSSIVDLNVSPAVLKRDGFDLRLLDSSGVEVHRFTDVSVPGTSFKLWLKTSGLGAGKYRLRGKVGKRESDLELVVYPR